jgi:hypothetical protein
MTAYLISLALVGLVAIAVSEVFRERRHHPHRGCNASVSATDAILNHGWRKVTQSLENGGEDSLKLIHRNERGIVYFAKRGFQNVAQIIKR